MSVWDGDDPTGASYFPEEFAERAPTPSAHRLDHHRSTASPTDLAILDALITNARQSHLIPMIELHDATGEWNHLQELVDFWVQPAVVTLIQKHQAYLLVNIGNEVGDNAVTAGQFIAGYTAAIQTLPRRRHSYSTGRQRRRLGGRTWTSSTPPLPPCPGRPRP